ncbi:MAG: CARDB domain-containing protein [Thermoproteota archaeon]
MSLAVLLNNVKSAKYSILDYEGDDLLVGFRVLGEDKVGGEDTWKVEWSSAQKGEEAEIVNLWISKSTGKCLQAEVRGTMYTGGIAEMMTYALFALWFTWIGAWQEAWKPETVYYYWEAGYGRLFFQGSETRTFGPTSLLVYKYRWEGYVNAPETFRGAVEWWFAPVSFGVLLVHFRVESDGEWWQVDLSSIELVNPQPLPNIVIDVTVNKERVRPNEEVTFSITASNTGNAIGAHNLTLTVNGEIKKSWLILLNPNERKSLSYSLTFSEEGTYYVRIGDKTFTITVSTIPPAKFEISNLSIDPSSIKIGQSSTISISVRNSGGQSGTYEVKLKVNNQVVDTKSVTLNPDQSTTVSFSFTPTSEGTYSIDVNGLTGSLIVSKEEAPSFPWLIIIAIVIVAVIVIIAVVFLRRKPAPKPSLQPPPPPS